MMSSQLLTDQGNVAIEAWVRLLRSHAATRRGLSAQLQAEHGLTVNDYEALLLLSKAEDGHMRRVDLAEGLALTPSGVTRLLDGLEEQGLCAKDTCSKDARVTYAVITDAGRKKLKESSCSHVGAVQALFEERFEPHELVTLAELLGRLPGAASADSSECTPD
jgi:DNA-binding MarR family transcriptional regulator